MDPTEELLDKEKSYIFNNIDGGLHFINGDGCNLGSDTKQLDKYSSYMLIYRMSIVLIIIYIASAVTVLLVR